MEWAHRFWGRVIGLGFFFPFVYFVSKGWIRGPLLAKCAGLFALGGMQVTKLQCKFLTEHQGALGWYMVKSGLDPKNFEENNSVPRVSQYRLAAHLSAAVALYSAMFYMGMVLFISFSEDNKKQGLKTPGKLAAPYGGPGIVPIQRFAMGTTALVFLTAFSGAFVAGLDAGLIYNTFPLMGDQVVPEGMFTKTPLWKNFFENDTTVQFNHRYLVRQQSYLFHLPNI